MAYSSPALEPIASSPEPADGLPQPRRTWAAISIWLALVLAVLDATIANVALPTIAQELGTTPASSIWVINAYQIAIVMTLLPLASLGEIVGYKRVYLVGLTLFILASASCTVATDLTSLAISRFVQGLGAAALMAVNGALMRFTYPKALLGRGIGYNALVIATGSAAGPSIAAAILAVASWRWLFAINLPIGLAALAMSWHNLPHTETSKRRYDWPKALLLAFSFAALFLGASGIAHGSAMMLPALELLAALSAFLALVWLSSGDPAPLVPLDLLRVRVLRLSYLTSACSFTAQMIAFVTLPFLFQARFGFDHVQTGLLLTPWPLATAVCAPLAGRLVERIPAAVLGCLGLAGTALGLAMMGLLPPGSNIALIVIAMSLCGAGFGIFQTPNNRTMLGNAPRARAGAAAGMLATSRLVGQTCGALCVAFIFHSTAPAGPLPLFVGAILAAFASVISLQRIRGSEEQVG